MCEAEAPPSARQERKTSLTPSKVSHEDFKQLQDSHDVEAMPVYTMDQVSANNGDDGRPVWMTYGGYVYDVTEFIPNHPGGTEKIRLASGGAIEPYWYLYRQHFASDLPMRLMEHMVIGRLDDKDQDEVDAAMAQFENSDDPYAKEPSRHKSLIVHSDTPMNAEVPSHLLTKSYITPTSLFYIRHHHPVPFLAEDEEKRFALELDLSECVGDEVAKGKKVIKISLDELRKLPKTTVTATLQCSGNRRSGFNQVERTSGTPWGQGAISTATFGGVKLTDLLKHVGYTDPVQLQARGMNHVVFSALDGMSASIGIEKALNPFGDVLVCWEMNGEILTREHGYPLRIVVPGYAAVRNVKWVHKIQLSADEAEGPWQRGLNYKTLPPGVTNASAVNLEDMPSMTEVSVFSGITHMETPRGSRVNPGDTVSVKASGWAWAGGGRNVVRVDVTPDDGNTWHTAEITQGKKQPFGRAWAWVFWQVDIPEAKVRADGTVQLASKAVDLAHNVQPETAKPMWNVRGLGNNSWYRAATKVVDDL
jgi:sulfite oxidase